MLALDDLNAAYKGAIIPVLVTQELISLQTTSYQKPLFWTMEKAPSAAEVYLVWQYRDKAVPIEIKSGKDGKLKSLHQFVGQAWHPYAVRLYAGAFSVEQHATPQKKTTVPADEPAVLPGDENPGICGVFGGEV